jgi:UDP-2,3-diacylglucosamine pyrophosphatase LpxH
MGHAPRGFAPPLLDHDLLVVSDLHLSEGRLRVEPPPGGLLPPGAGKFSRNEDFFFDEQFARFLLWHQERRRARPLHLVVNGDFLDFLQVIEVEGADRGESGPGTGPEETELKLVQVARGHWVFFEALAGFVVAGNSATIIRGNHDVELCHAAVRLRLLELLREAYRQRAARDPEYARRPARGAIDGATVRFADWFYYEERNLWIEHGNQYESTNSFRYWLAPLLPANEQGTLREEIDLPLGSFFVRYLFNKVEETAPFADNVKPPTRFVRWLVSRHPLTALRFVFHGGLYMAVRLWRASRWVPDDRWETRRSQHRDALQALAAAAGIEPARLQGIDGLRQQAFLQESHWARFAHLTFPLLVLAAFALLALCALALFLAALPILLSLLPDRIGGRLLHFLMFPAARPLDWGRKVLLGIAVAGAALWGAAFIRARLRQWRSEERRKAGGLRPVPGDLARAAAAISDALGVKYVAMGHTHDADLWSIDGKGREYFNTGTWTTVFSEGEERLVREDVEFIFLYGERVGSSLRMRLMEWEDGAGEPRYLKLFRGDGDE